MQLARHGPTTPGPFSPMRRKSLTVPLRGPLRGTRAQEDHNHTAAQTRYSAVLLGFFDARGTSGGGECGVINTCAEDASGGAGGMLRDDG